MNNNANIEMLFKLIIPAIFVVLWTLNSLFNKELQNQQRAQRAGSPLGPRPGLPPLNRPAPGQPRPQAGDLERPSGGWRELGGSPEGVVLLPEAGEAGWPPRPKPARPASPQPRKNGRSRGGKTRPAPAAPQRESASKPIVSAHLSPTSAQDAAARHDVFDAPQVRTDMLLTAERMRGMLRDPSSLRQVLVLHEILNPPRSSWSRRLGRR
jgi:hypothetical protein